jgi:small nuclear ribonucleoprotein F
MDLNNPNIFLKLVTGKSVNIKLKWGMVYRGKLEAVDYYMNVRLSEAEEWIGEKKIGNLGHILIRCNNIIYIAENFQAT